MWTGFYNIVAGGENAPGSNVTISLTPSLLEIMEDKIIVALEPNQGHALAMLEELAEEKK